MMIVFYCVLDPAMTYLVLQSGGVETEPVAMWFLTQFSSFGLVVQKLAILPVIVAFAVILTFVARLVDQPPQIYRSVVPAIIALGGMQLIVTHIENLAILL